MRIRVALPGAISVFRSGSDIEVRGQSLIAVKSRRVRSKRTARPG